MTTTAESFDALTTALLAPARAAAVANAEAIAEVVRELANRVEQGGRLFAFGAGHAYAFAAELCSRAGGMPNWTAMNLDDLRTEPRPAHCQLADSEPERLAANGPALARFHGLGAKDALLIASQSGRNASQVELAQWARAEGIYLVAILSRAHSAAFASRHSSGQKLGDLADVVLDLHTPPGDAVLRAENGRAVSGASTIAFALLAQLINARLVQEITTRGQDPQVILSANIDRDKV